MPPLIQRLENSAAPFEAIGKLIVKNWDEGKDAGSYQCLLNDANRIELATINVERIFGKYILILVFTFKRISTQMNLKLK